MKTLKNFLMMLFVSVAAAGLMVACSDDDNGGKPDFTADYPELPAVNGKVVIAAYFGTTPCNNVAFVGSYNGWSEDPQTMQKFAPVGTVDGKEWAGWYKVEIDTTGAATEKEVTNADGTKSKIAYPLAGKPVQLTKDGAFSWDYQVGYDPENTEAPLKVTAKTSGVDIYAGFSRECDIYYSGASVAIVFDGWKKDPCITVPKHTYTFNVTVPAGTPDTIYMAGAMQGWDNSATPIVKDAQGKYSITWHEELEEGTPYKYLINKSWDNEELLAIEEGAECAKGIPGGNRATGTSATINDVVANWKDVTASKCPE